MEERPDNVAIIDPPGALFPGALFPGCDICKEDFTRKQAYDTHLESERHKKTLGDIAEHKKNECLKIFRCHSCNKAFASELNLYRHKKTPKHYLATIAQLQLSLNLLTKKDEQDNPYVVLEELRYHFNKYSIMLEKILNKIYKAEKDVVAIDHVPQIALEPQGSEIVVADAPLQNKISDDSKLLSLSPVSHAAE